MNLERLNQQELAEIMGISTRSLQLMASEGIPVHGKGKGLFYAWSEVRPWWLERNVRISLGGRAFGASAKEELKELAEYQLLNEKYEAEIKEMKAKKMKGETLDAAEVKKVWSDFLLRLRANLMGWADRAVPRILEAASLSEAIAVGKEELNAALRAEADGQSDAA